MATQVYKGPNRNRYLARIRDNGAAVPEMFGSIAHFGLRPGARRAHGAHPISEQEALTVVDGWAPGNCTLWAWARLPAKQRQYLEQR